MHKFLKNLGVTWIENSRQEKGDKTSSVLSNHNSLVATLQNIVASAHWCSVFVHPCPSGSNKPWWKRNRKIQRSGRQEEC